jgi:hypothetical protein
MVTPTLNRLLIYTVEDSISKLQNIDQERFVKIQKYNKKKNEYIDSRITPMMTSSREILAKWYDKFIEYSNMGFLSCKQYWKCLCDNLQNVNIPMCMHLSFTAFVQHNQK